MLDVTGWPAATDAVTPSVKVVHNGVERQVEGVTVQRELPSSFAQQVVGLGGLTAADGRIDWADSDDVEEGSTPHPFAFPRTWPPKSGDKIEVSVGYNDTMAKVLTGKIKDVSGSPFEQPSSSVVDYTGRLDRRVSIPPLQHIMPPEQEGGAYRHIGLYPTFFTDKLARVGGYNSTPPMSSGCVLSVPCMGSLWPERGSVFAAESFTTQGASPNWRVTPWTVGVSNVTAEYTPNNALRLDKPMEITAMFNVMAGAANIAIRWGGLEIRLRHDGTRAQGQVRNAGGDTNVAQLSNHVGNVFALRVTPNGANITMTVRDSAGNEATGIFPTPSEVSGVADLVRITSSDVDAHVGGVQVAFPSTAWTAVNYTRKAFLTLAAHSANLPASPAIVNRNALDMLQEQSKAELAAMWIDQEDRLHWVNRNTLISRSPVGTLTAMDNLLDLPWHEDNSAVTSVVTIKYQKATPQRRRNPTITLWESGASGVDTGDIEEEIIHPGADEDWVHVDTQFRVFNNGLAASILRLFNRGHGSWIAVYAEEVDAEPPANTWAGAGALIRKWDHETYSVWYQIGYVGNGGWDYTLKIPSETSGGNKAGPMRWQPGLSTPVIRGMARNQWTDEIAVTFGSDDNAPELDHDAGWWVQDPSGVQELADWLANETSVPMVTLRGVPIVPDSRIELGDIYWVEDLAGLRIKGLITGINQQISGTPAAWDMDLSVLVLNVETP